jgi:ornithine carbamoyltransferase
MAKWKGMVVFAGVFCILVSIGCSMTVSTPSNSKMKDKLEKKAKEDAKNQVVEKLQENVTKAPSKAAGDKVKVKAPEGLKIPANAVYEAHK